MSDAKEMKTLMNPTTYLGLDEESTKVDGTQYKAMVVLTHWQVHQIITCYKVNRKSEYRIHRLELVYIPIFKQEKSKRGKKL